jgi:DNA (cytosine-5)-methyltransferase 1
LINFDLYNSANFGTPQARERIVIIGTTNNIKVNRLKPTHSNISEYNLPKWRTLKYALKKLKNIDNSEHLNYNPKRVFYYEKLKSGENWKNLPIDLQKKALGGSFYLGGGKTGFLRRLDWNKPSPTLVTSPSMPATDLCHPEEIRPLSVNEYKVIQQFPISWKLGGTTIDKYRQIGNAVPVGLGRAIGREIKNHFLGQFKDDIKDFKYSRYNNTSYNDFINDFEKKNLQLQLFG